MFRLIENRRKKLFFSLFLLILIFSLCLVVKFFCKKEKLDNLIPYKKEEINNLTLEQKIGQLFIIGLEGKTITPKIEDTMKKIHPGGVLLLGWNIEDKEQLTDLIGGLQKIAKEDTNIPLFIAVDQEGGVVSRIGWADNTSQAEIKNQEEALKIGEKRGKELKELGINLNFAPLLDSVSPGDFIFNRSFKKNSEESADLAMSLIEGQRNSGIFSALKHFPGYGGIIYNPEEELAFFDVVPEISQFLKASVAMPEMIMASNVVYKDIDENLPFSFSLKGIDYLKKTIKGNYLIISDDLAQNSLLNKFSLERIIFLPIKAGVDILIFSGWRASPADAFEAFLKSVSQGKITEDRINQSVSKIISLKKIISE